MRAYSSMPMDEFVGQLRDIAIRAKAAPAVIDKLDKIDTSDKDEEIEKIAAELDDMTDNRNDLADELRNDLADELRAVEKALCDDDLTGDRIKSLLTGISDALSRSG